MWSDKGANVESESLDHSNLVEYALKNLYAKFGALFQCLQLFSLSGTRASQVLNLRKGWVQLMPFLFVVC